MIKSHPFCLKHIDFHVHSIVNIENDKVSLWGFKLVSSSSCGLWVVSDKASNCRRKGSVPPPHHYSS